MTPVEELKRKKEIVDAFFHEALGVMEIATLHNASIQDVLEVLRETQCGSERIRASERFKKKVVEFAVSHPYVSTTNVARAFALKDEKSVRTWWKIYGQKNDASQDQKQYSLLAVERGLASEKQALVEKLEAEKNELQERYMLLKDRYDALVSSIGGIVGSARDAVL